ncbi:LysR substrate-binding domain-containing protein [Rhodopila sp.]|jgi:LysR family hca operon transcriptional activator|uniref:LysR substrate-binding domain-containing protein n=1 Tax=Rhodopila sp. TaxID=2480087 RepID=UPI002D0378D0|nr:LysR substrate-binding domain-containing protein [Rhodopila sp.]HVZ07571.1 LysR substrate-binding domain-containing protein [Rhodopila sp.]
MELRHLRYFVAVAEEGSFTRAAETRLHTAQPSLSRQIRDLEEALKVRLIDRGPRGMTLTPAGTVFLDHARAILARVDAAIDAARRADRPARTRFTVGFLTGHEIGWLPRVARALGDDLDRIELVVHSASSPELLRALLREEMDIAFLRPSEADSAIAFVTLVEEALFVLLPAGHRLARRKTVPSEALHGERFIAFSTSYSPVLRRTIDSYLEANHIEIIPVEGAETLPMVVSLVLSNDAVTLLPAYMRPLLPASVVARPLAGVAPTIPLALGYRAGNESTVLARFLGKLNELAASD